MKTKLACLLLLFGMMASPSQAGVEASCITTKKFITDFQTGLGAPITLTEYSQQNTIKLLLIFYKDFGIDISKIDPKKLTGSIIIKSDRFPNAVVMIMTSNESRTVACYETTLSMKIYKYAVDKLGLTEI